MFFGACKRNQKLQGYGRGFVCLSLNPAKPLHTRYYARLCFGITLLNLILGLEERHVEIVYMLAVELECVHDAALPSVVHVV